MLSKNRQSVKIFAIFISLSLLTLFIDKIDKGEAVYGLIGKLNKPIAQKLFYFKASLLRPLDWWRWAKQGYQQTETLRQREQNLLSELSDAQALSQENQLLKNQLNLKTDFIKPKIIAHLISGGNNYLLDQGSKAGAAEGMKAVIDNVLVGVITTVGPETSQLTLLGSPDLNIAVVVRPPNLQTTAKAHGEIVDFKDDKLILDKALLKQKFSPDDIVVTDLNDNMPADLLIGRVANIFRDESQAYQQAEIEPFIKREEIRTVFLY